MSHHCYYTYFDFNNLIIGSPINMKKYRNNPVIFKTVLSYHNGANNAW